jgi:hypothetical protein
MCCDYVKLLIIHTTRVWNPVPLCDFVTDRMGKVSYNVGIKPESKEIFK